MKKLTSVVVGLGMVLLLATDATAGLQWFAKQAGNLRKFFRLERAVCADNQIRAYNSTTKVYDCVDVVAIKLDHDMDGVFYMSADGSEVFIDVDDDGTADFTFNTTGIDVPRQNQPQVCFGDAQDVADVDDNVCINVNCTAIGAGAQDCDIWIAQQISGGMTTAVTFDADGVITFTRDVVVPAEAYGGAWDASNETPTKNDVFDKVEAIDTTGIYWAPFGPFGNDQAGVVAADNCECWRVSIPVTITPDRIGVNVSTQDADDVANLAIYSSDGNTRHATCTLVVTATGYKNCTDGSATVMTPGDYWVCVGAGVGSPVVFQLKRAGGGDLYAYVDLTTTCTTGVMPATISFTPALSNDSIPYVVIFDD